MKKAISTALVTAAAYSTTAHAALPPDVQSTIDTVKDDITTVGAALVVLAVVVMGFRWLKAQFF